MDISSMLEKKKMIFLTNIFAKFTKMYFCIFVFFIPTILSPIDNGYLSCKHANTALVRSNSLAQ